MDQAKEIAKKIKWLLNQDINLLKTTAFEIGYNRFSTTVLMPQYQALLENQ